MITCAFSVGQIFYLKNQITCFWIFRRMLKSEIKMCITAFKITL